MSVVRDYIRRKPLVICVGVEKCGTSSFHDFLAQGKNVSSPYPKELEFFSNNFENGLDWYLAHYHLSKHVLLDFTPSYHWDSRTLDRIKDTCARPSVIAMLRNPIKRAYSAYIHRIYWFFQTAAKTGTLDEYDVSFDDLVHSGHSYLFPSYLEILDRIDAIFGSKNCVVIPLEFVAKQPHQYVSLIEENLSADLQIDRQAVMPRSNVLHVPIFLTGREIVEEYPQYAFFFNKELDDVYFCCGGIPRKIASGDEYSRMKAIEAKWLRPVEKATGAKVLSRYYQAELSQLEERLEADLDCWRIAEDWMPRVVRPFSDAAVVANPHAELLMIQLTDRRGQRREAIAAAKRALSRHPAMPEFHRYLARMLMEEGDTAEAATHAGIAAELAPADGSYQVFKRTVANRQLMKCPG